MKSKLLFISLFIQTTVFSAIEKAKDSIGYNQRNFDSSFQDNYKGDEFNYEPLTKVNDLSAWDRFWNAVGRFLQDLFDFGGIGNSMNGLQILFKIIAILVIIFVVYLIVKVIINKEGGWIFSKSAKKINVVENVEENIHSIDFKKIVNQAVSDKNYRVAVRYYYLWLLKSLSDKDVIEWDIEKTNRDYYNEISNTDTKKSFQFLSYIYEYSWYGEFELTQEDFQKAEQTFIKNIK